MLVDDDDDGVCEDGVLIDEDDDDGLVVLELGSVGAVALGDGELGGGVCATAMPPNARLPSTKAIS